MFRDRLDFCSNFFRCRKGIRYYDELLKQTILVDDSEILYQVSKTLIPEERKLFFPHIYPQPDRNGKMVYGKPLTAGEAKRLGKRVTLRKDWDVKKDGIMHDILRMKFEQNPDLIERLLATGEEFLVEENYWHDNYWGSCLCSRCGNKGKNNLGVALMKERQHWKYCYTGVHEHPSTGFGT